MKDTPVFERVAADLEAHTSLGRMQARGTVRLALREAGLEGSEVTQDQMLTVVDRLLPVELASLQIDGTDRICAALREAIETMSADAFPGSEGADEIFRRLGG